MDFQHKEFNKNKIIVPVILVIIIIAGYAVDRLSHAMRPLTLDEYERRSTAPQIPQPFFLR